MGGKEVLEWKVARFKGSQLGVSKNVVALEIFKLSEDNVTSGGSR